MAGKVLVWVDGKSFEAQPGSVIGRDLKADIVVSHPDVSRRHAEIRRGASGLELVDLGSTNGIWVGGVRMQSVPLTAVRHEVCLGSKDTAPKLTIVVEAQQTSSQRDMETRIYLDGSDGHSGSGVDPSQQPAAPPESPRPVPANPVPPNPVPPTPVAAGAAQASTAGAQTFENPNANGVQLNNSDLAGNLGQLSQVLEVGQNRLLVGRSKQCEVVIDDPLVSRRHAELVYTSPTSAKITDLGSDNGTYVNGVRIRSIGIVDGDLIELGRTQLVLRQGRLEQHLAYGLPLQAANLSVVVGKNTRILNDVSFNLPAGSLTAIVGPSGSGKTTLLNALTSRRQADTGAVFLGGRNVYDKSGQVSQRIGFVPQDDPVHGNLSVSHALTAAAKMRLPQDTSKQEIEHNVLRVAAELGLSERLTTPVKALSGGQRKRVSVGYELVGEPQALILDEPTSGLDPGLERELMTNLRELANRGTTTVVVTHSVQSVELCDQVLVLAPGGRLAFIGPPDRAISHFGVSDLASVFTLLSSRPDTEWERHFAETSSYFRFVGSAPTPGASASAPKSRRSFVTDLGTMIVRYLRLLGGDKRRLVFLLAQAPLLGGLLALVLKQGGFDITARSATREYLVAMVLAMTLIGVLNSVREIVQDREVFRREFAVGVSSTAFVLSRWIVLTSIVVVQAIVLVFVGSLRQNSALGEGVILGSAWIELLLAVAGIGVSSVGIGLVVSAFVNDTPKALTMFPLVVIPAMLMSGLFVPTSGRVGVEQLTYLNPIQWGSSSAASVLNLPGSESCDTPGTERVNLPNGLVGEQDRPDSPSRGLSPSCSNSLWTRTTRSQGLNFFMQVVSNLVLLAAAAYGARRSLTLPLRR